MIPWLKAKTTAQQQEYMLSTVRVLVYAAEQLYGAASGEEKLAYVQEELAERGLKVDVAAIEAAVREMDLLQNWESALTFDDDEFGEEYDGE